MSSAAAKKNEFQGGFQPAYDSPTDLAWRVIGLVNLYRLVVPVVLYTLQRVTGPTPFVGGESPELFDSILTLYFMLGSASSSRNAARGRVSAS